MKTQSIIGIAVVVVLIIAVSTVVGFVTLPKSTSTTSINSAKSTTSVVASTSTSSISSSSTSSQPKTGQFAMGATDPPIAASGVTDAKVVYNGVAVHKAGFASNSGWVTLNSTGTIDLMSSANISQTIAEASIQSGTYDMARINIVSGTVVYNDKNYTAAIASGTINASLQQKAQVNSSAPSEAIIDLRTFIINSGNSTSPQYIISACARATAVPPNAVTSASLQVGAKTALIGKAWWTAFVDQTSNKIVITSATLTNGSLNLVLKNTGNATADVQTVIVTPISSAGSTSVSLPASLASSSVFALSSSGSMQQSNTLQGVALLSSVGTQVSAASSVTLNYSGPISLGFGLSGVLHITGIVSGQQYLITCMGANTYSNLVVVAQ